MYFLLVLVSRLFCFLPKRLSLSIGSGIGYLFFLFSKRKKAQALKNLKLAFPRKTYNELLEIVRKSFQDFGMSIIESLRIPKENKDFSSSGFIIEGEEYLSSIVKDKGMFSGIHMGSWELFNISLAKLFSYFVIARRQKHRPFEEFLHRQRIREGLHIVYEDDARGLIRHLKKGYILGLVFDHGSRDSNIFAEFFGKLIPVPMGPLRLALSFKKKIYPGCFTRCNKVYHKLKLFPPVEVKTEDDFPKAAQQLNAYYEEFLKENPEGYLWWYKRFKRSKNLHILILSDSKAGHLKQSLSLASLIKEKRPQSYVDIVEINLSKAKRALLDICNLFSSSQCLGCGSCLRRILGRDFERLYRYADIFLSCGSSLSSLNRILSYVLDAKSFIIHKPNIGMHKHDLVVLPSHDLAACRKNIVKTSGSFSLLDIRELEEARDKLKEISGGFSGELPKIGVFIGGPLDKGYKQKDSINLLKILKSISKRNNWQLFITTSRRTPSFVEEYLKQSFKHAPLLVIANEKNFPFVAPGIISLCDAVVVSSDSISMITESGQVKPTLVFDIFHASKSKKHAEFVAELSKEGRALRVDSDTLEHLLKEVLEKKIVLKGIDNKSLVEKALELKL
ncbi:MAG: mitochondrial fission ELM1 family protein [Candidatus Omnitrophica bacterium]|nr:mitochondrial fission ELM1 family protein [Candidatus Omnitrophota bacterium]